MRNFSVGSLLVAAIALIALTSTYASAQATRTWVSGVGDDVNPCSRTAPCKTFAGAISKTAAGGEISVLDPGGFGGVTITTSMTISGDGTLASVLNVATNGIIINAAVTDVIHLRNLSIAGAGSGLNGVRILQAGTVSLEKVTISEQINGGVEVSTAQTTPLYLSLRDVSIRNVINAAAVAGIRVANTTTGVVNVQLDNVHIQGVQYVGSAAPAPRPAGIIAGARTTIQIDRSTINQAAIGISATAADAVVYLSDSTVTHNATGLATSNGGQIISYNNNRLIGNTTNGAPTSTVYQR